MSLRLEVDAKKEEEEAKKMINKMKEESHQ